MSKHSRKAKRMQRSRSTRSKWLADWLKNEIAICDAIATSLSDPYADIIREASKPKAER